MVKETLEDPVSAWHQAYERGVSLVAEGLVRFGDRATPDAHRFFGEARGWVDQSRGELQKLGETAVEIGLEGADLEQCRREIRKEIEALDRLGAAVREACAKTTAAWN